MDRIDISPYVVHFTSGGTSLEACSTLRRIITEGRLQGSSVFIKGGFSCVCFSEAPLASLRWGLVNENAYSRYSPFGVMFSKSWIFSRGGRPVIYGSDEEYNSLPDTHRWGHVLYRPDSDEPIDFTWEREWRLQCSHLEFGPESVNVVVPNREWADYLMKEYENDQDYLVMQYSTVFDSRMTAEMYRESWRWNILTLDQS